MFVQCNRCEEVAEVPWTTSFPVRCPHHDHNAAYPAMICTEGHIFTVDELYQRHVNCPTCGTTNVRPVQEEDLP